MDLEDRSVPEALGTGRAADVAIRYDGETRTFADLRRSAALVADAATRAGHRGGEPAAVWLPNRPAWLHTFVGFAALGAPVVPVNTRYRTSELEHILRDSNARTLVMQTSFLTREFVSMLLNIFPALDEMSPQDLAESTRLPLDRVVVIDEDGEPLPAAATSYDAFIASGRADSLPTEATGSDPCAVFYTSGTTSKPKGAVHDHASVVNHARAMAEYLGVDRTDRALGVMPLCGNGGFDFATSALLVGASVTLQDRFEGERAARAIDEQDLTYLLAIGEMYEGILETDHDLTSLERGTVYLTDDAQMERIERRCEFPVGQPYGLTEARSHICLTLPNASQADRFRPGGPPIHEAIDVEIRHPETGKRLPAGEIGEIHVKGYSRMVEYYDNPEQTAAAIDEAGWLATGDAGELDADGALTFHSRLDDMLRLRGYQVKPQEIEGAIEGHESVRRAQVVGAIDEGREVAVAFVIQAEGADLTDSNLAAFLNDRVADFKVPATFEWVDEYPTTKSPNGEKIQRTVLADRAQELL